MPCPSNETTDEAQVSDGPEAVRSARMTVDVSEEEKLVTPPVPEYLSPLRWRWILFVTRRQEVRFLYRRPGIRPGTAASGCSTGTGTLRRLPRREHKTSITTEYQRQGIGRRLIRRALADGSGYTWQTTGQSPEAKRFFPVLEKEMGTAFLQHGGVCEHLASPPGYRPPDGPPSPAGAGARHLTPPLYGGAALVGTPEGRPIAPSDGFPPRFFPVCECTANLPRSLR